MATWQDRLKAVIGPRGYHDSMRRSLQTIILYEAKRAVEPRYKSLRPYQRKATFMEQCYFLLDSLDGFLFPHQKEEIMWRTMTSRVPLDGGVAWARLKCIGKELKSLSEQIQPFMAPGRTHSEAVDLLIQSLYVQAGKDGANKDKPVPWTYEYSHNHCITAFRLYYDGDIVDSKFPAPAIAAPPPASVKTTGLAAAHHHHDPAPHHYHDSDEPALDVAAILAEGKDAAEDHRLLLQEVRQHLDLLKEFEGVISEEEIAKRKRELFLALPPAPASGSTNKKPKVMSHGL